jgi:hypothetical protein
MAEDTGGEGTPEPGGDQLPGGEEATEPQGDPEPGAGGAPDGIEGDDD